jgi:hypothetical protein
VPEDERVLAVLVILRRIRVFATHPDVLGVAWVVAAAIAVLVPALAHGASLGPFDQLSRYGLSSQPGTVVHYTGPGDQIEMLIPWTTLAWTQVHHGHLPLWNPYSGLGMPLVFNWQAASFSVPALIGYLFPVHLAFTVAEVVTLLIAGSGVYVLARVLHVGVLGAATAATVYELSGPFMGWLGWPNSAAMSWAGWMFAAAILIVRGRHRSRDIALFAVVLACAVYAGQPETVVLFGMALVVFIALFLVLRARASESRDPVLRPLVDLGLAAAAGAALSAPLALPGLQLASTSVVRVVSTYGALPAHDLRNILFQGFDGLPVAGNQWFGTSIYPESAVYVGVIALCLAVVAVGTRRRRPEVVAFALTAVAMAVIAYVSPVVSAINQITGLRSVAWHRSIQPMDLALAVLAGVGMDALVHTHAQPAAQRAVRRWAAGAFGTVGVIVALLWLVGRGRLPSVESGIRARSFVWPAIEIVIGLVVVGALSMGLARRRPHLGRGAGLVLLACETAFLVSAGAPLVSSSPIFLVPTPAETALRQAVGSSLVAFGSRDCHTPPTLGIHQDVNVVYGVRELADWDPMTPEATFKSLKAATGQPAGAVDAPLILCPAVDTATVARRYGVGFILTHASSPRPTGTVFVTSLSNEKLYRVPGAAAATLTPLGTGGALPSPDATGAAVAVTHPDAAQWELSTDAAGASVLRLHLADVPGWHATVDGHGLALQSFSGSMIQARVPGGRHVVVLRYWPSTFTAGLVLGLLSLAGLLGGVVVETRIRRRRRRSLG